MGKGSRETTQRTEQNNEWQNRVRPPDWALPGFQDSTNEANRIYNERRGSGLPGLSGGTNDAIAGLGQNARDWGNASSAENNLQDWANGSMIGNNQQFQQALQNQLNNVAGTINSQFAGAGRSGSGANAGVLGRELGNVATNALANQYNQDVQNQFRANQQIDQSQQGRLAGQGNAWGNALRGSGVQDKWNMANDQRAWDELGQWQNALGRGTGGASDSSGSSKGSGTNVTETPNNPWANIGSVIGGIGSAMAPGSGGGGGGKGKSDVRAKDHIEFKGVMNGYRIYDFNYKGLPERYRGVMAQDILSIMPDAVSIDPTDGLFMVDYDKIGFQMKRVN